MEPLTIEEQIMALRQDLDSIAEDITFIKEHIVKSSTVIEKVGAEVMPTLNGLMESPMLKMLLPKGALKK